MKERILKGIRAGVIKPQTDGDGWIGIREFQKRTKISRVTAYKELKRMEVGELKKALEEYEEYVSSKL